MSAGHQGLALTLRARPGADRARSRSAGRGECGRGAWEIGCRFQILDLVDAPINGGRLQNATLGVNWYWNPNMKMQFNYDYLWRDPYGLDPARGSVHGFGTRMAVFF